MRSGSIVALTLLAALFGAAACHREDPEPEVQPRLLSVSVSEKTLVLPANESMTFTFRVEEPGYVFNYTVEAPGCQVRLSGKDGKTPSEFKITRILPGAEAGTYTAVVTDAGVETDYKREVRLLVENSNYLSYSTSPHAQYGLVNGEAIWYARLFQDPAFKAQVKARFQELLPELEKIPDYMDECEKLLTQSARLNFAMWNPADDRTQNGGHIINGDENMSFHDAVARLKGIYKDRLKVIPKNL